MAEYPGKPVNLGGTAVNLPEYTPVDPSTFIGGNGGTVGKLTADEMIANIRTAPAGLSNVPATALPLTGRFNNAMPYADTEEMAGQQQSSWDKWGNGLAKMTGTAGTTFLNGTVGTVVGIGSMIKDGRFASLYDNEFNRNLDEFNKRMENSLPNYYTHAEQDAIWYSPQNVLTANFWSDKVVKNLGFSAGALAGGFAWGAMLKAIGITNRLVQAGKGLETITAIDNAIATAPAAGRFGAIAEALTGLSSKLKPLAATALSNADRTVVSVMGTMGEAGIESLQNMNQFRDNLINEYINVNGIRPEGVDLEEINAYADKVGNFTWGMNVALLSATNYIQLPKILNTSRTAEKRMINDVVKENAAKGATIAEQVASKYKAVPGFLEDTLGKPGRLLNNIVVRPLSLAVAPIEAFEEGMQFASQIGVNNYFNRAYQNQEDVTDFFKNATEAFDNVLGEGVSEALTTKEGLESILIGGISGGIQTSFSPFGQSRIKQEGFTGQGGVQGKNTQLALDALNKSKNLNAVLKDAVKYASIAISSQKARQGYIVSGDTLQEKDYEKDYTLAYVMPRVKYGKIDSIKEELSLYKKQAMSEKGFEELKASGVILPNETREKFLKRIASIENTADKVAETYEMVNDKYSALLDDTGKLAYTPDVVDKLVYATAKILDYDQRAAELSNSLSLRGVSSYTVMEDLLEGKKESYLEQIKVINDNNKLTSDQKTALKEDLQDLGELALRRKEYLKQYEEVKKNPNNFKDTPNVDKKKDAEGKPVETVSIKTKDGEEKVNIGEEYFLGRVVEYDKSGKEVYRFPRITILGENPDGTIKIKQADGTVRDVSKAVLESYKLGKVKDTLSNKKAKFYLDNINKIFEFNFGKGKKQKGRIQFDPKSNIMYFIYKDKQGKIREIEVTGDQFVPKKGFSNPMISAVGGLTVAEKQSLDEFVGEKDERVNAKREARLNILTELFDELIGKQAKTKQSILQKQNQIKDIREELASLEESIKSAEFDARSKKVLRFKSQTKKALEAAIILSRMKDQLEKEVESLQSDEQELEFNASYVADLAQNIDELPTNSGEFLEELKEQKSLLESAILETGKNINTISNLIDKVQDALTSAIKLVLDNINRFEKRYPEVPRELDQKWIDFLQQNPKLPESFKKEEYKQALREINEFVSQVEDLDISPNERTLGELKEELVSLQKSLEQTERELKAKDAILFKFEEIAEKYKQQKEEENKLASNQALRQKFLGTHSVEDQNNFDTRPYQPEKKKDNNSVINGTVGRFKVGSKEKPHEIRANTFGINFPNLKNKAKLRAIEITAKTEALAGIPGLIDHLIVDYNTQAELKGKATIDKNSVVVAIFVQDEGNGKFSFVDENGGIITENLIEKGIYQVRPTEKLVQDYSKEQDGSQYETSFRDTTPKEVQEELKARYKAEREKILASEVLEPMKEFSPSFGILLYEQKSDKDGNLINDWDAKNPVTETGLVSGDDLSEKPVLKVATTNDIVGEGKTTFKNALGRVFLSIPGVGMLKLNNSKLGRKRAEAVYEAILQLAKNAQTDPENGVKNSEPILNWLKSVVYWGIQHKLQTNERKEPSYNSIWFEDTTEGTRLFISGKDQNFTFTPSKLESSKEAIITILEATYHNTSNKMVSEPIDKKYTEYVGIDKEGKLIPGKTWDNYQTYLLSPEGRKSEEIPLTTPVLAIKEDKKVNREGIYFVLENNIDSEVAQKKAPEPKKVKSIFSKAEKAFDGFEEDNDLKPESFSIEDYENALKPDLKELTLLTNKQIAGADSSEEMVILNKKQEEIKKQFKILEELKNCLWKN